MPSSPKRPPEREARGRLKARAGAAALQPFLADGAGFAGEPGWLAELRREARARFQALGFPTQRLESWKYTRLRPLESTRFRAAGAADGAVRVEAAPALLDGHAPAFRLVFANGRPRPELSRTDGLPEGASVLPLADALARDGDWLEANLGRVGDGAGQALMALSMALADGGVVVRLAPGVALERPLELVFLGGRAEAPIATFPRHLIVLEADARATVVEHHAGLGPGAYLVNAGVEIAVGPGAALRHYRVQADSLDATHLSTAHVRVDRGALYDGFALAIGGRLSRNETWVRLDGRGAECRLSGAYLMRGAEHCDTTTVIEHTVPDTRSREVFKGVLDDESRGVFQGRIVVHRDAQRSDGHQECKALLLSTGAEVDHKPELEIYADDVKCSHGAAAGQIDEAALFYLRSRGIPEALARNIMIQSFLAEALDEVADPAVRAALNGRVQHWLPAACYLQEEWRGR
jgi:Fe-S cluster assembly protein SufD